MEWDKVNQLMYWYPSPSESENQIIFSVGKELEVDALPKELGHAQAKPEFVGTFP
jgi:hypothetical protein